MRVQIYETAGMLHTCADRLAAARECFELALRLEEHARLRLLAGMVCTKLGQRDSAMVHLGRCIDLKPNSELAATAKALIAELPTAEQLRTRSSGCGVYRWLSAVAVTRRKLPGFAVLLVTGLVSSAVCVSKEGIKIPHANQEECRSA
jgi:hypothetical protein